MVFEPLDLPCRSCYDRSWHFFSGTSGGDHATSTEAPQLNIGVPDTPTHPLNCPEELGAEFEHTNYPVGFQHRVCAGNKPTASMKVGFLLNESAGSFSAPGLH